MVKKRSLKEISEYLDEAFHKVWYMRSHPCEIPEIEEKRIRALKEIEEKYPEVTEGFDDWECGYWNGILGALRWVLKDDKNMLDT